MTSELRTTTNKIWWHDYNNDYMTQLVCLEWLWRSRRRKWWCPWRSWRRRYTGSTSTKAQTGRPPWAWDDLLVGFRCTTNTTVTTKLLSTEATYPVWRWWTWRPESRCTSRYCRWWVVGSGSWCSQSMPSPAAVPNAILTRSSAPYCNRRCNARIATGSFSPLESAAVCFDNSWSPRRFMSRLDCNPNTRTSYSCVLCMESEQVR